MISEQLSNRGGEDATYKYDLPARKHPPKALQVHRGEQANATAYQCKSLALILLYSRL